MKYTLIAILAVTAALANAQTREGTREQDKSRGPGYDRPDQTWNGDRDRDRNRDHDRDRRDWDHRDHGRHLDRRERERIIHQIQDLQRDIMRIRKDRRMSGWEKERRIREKEREMDRLADRLDDRRHW